MKRILVTGGAGFIGSHFIRYLLRGTDDLHIVNLDLLTYAGNPANLAAVADDPRYTFAHGDVRDGAAVAELFAAHDFDTVVNFAAESHVDRSIDAPQAFLTTNLLGTQVLLDAAKHHWKLTPDDPRDRAYRPGVLFLQISTDEVYGSLCGAERFTETTPLAPNSPYAASKAGADLLARAYYETYGMPICITRASNNYGSHQYPEKLIPLMLAHCLRGEPLPVYGDGLQVRDWLHADDHCAALDAVLRGGVSGEVYNVGGDCERTNLELVRLLLALTGQPESLIRFVPDRPGHDRRYAIDHTKITTLLGWRPTRPFAQGISETVAWYRAHPAWLRT